MSSPEKFWLLFGGVWLGRDARWLGPAFAAIGSVFALFGAAILWRAQARRAHLAPPGKV